METLNEMGREDPQSNFRFPATLKAWLKKDAERARRTYNSHVVHALEWYRKEKEAGRAP